MAIKKNDPPRKPGGRKIKEELQEAYTGAMELQQQEADVELKPEKLADEKKAHAAVQVAEALSGGNVSREIFDLKTEVARLLTDLSEKLDTQVARFRELQKAIAVKEAEIQELYGIEKQAASLAALIEAQARAKTQFKADSGEEQQRLEAEMAATRVAWTKEQKDREQTWKETIAADVQKRERDKTEFQYAFQREQQQIRDKFNDEQSKLERALAEKKATVDKDLAERTKLLKEAEAELTGLRTKAAAFPAELDAAVNKAVKEATDRQKNEHAAAQNLAKKEFEGERNVLNARLDSLQATVKHQAEQIAKLTQQHELAYEKVQNIAVRAIEGSANQKTLATFHEMLLDQPKKQPREEK
jgi:hypothetical protein